MCEFRIHFKQDTIQEHFNMKYYQAGQPFLPRFPYWSHTWSLESDSMSIVGSLPLSPLLLPRWQPEHVLRSATTTITTTYYYCYYYDNYVCYLLENAVSRVLARPKAAIPHCHPLLRRATTVNKLCTSCMFLAHMLDAQSSSFMLDAGSSSFMLAWGSDLKLHAGSPEPKLHAWCSKLKLHAASSELKLHAWGSKLKLQSWGSKLKLHAWGPHAWHSELIKCKCARSQCVFCSTIIIATLPDC